jgi:hypothetical protein
LVAATHSGGGAEDEGGVGGWNSRAGGCGIVGAMDEGMLGISAGRRTPGVVGFFVFGLMGTPLFLK